MESLKVLVAEHRFILRLLGALQRWAEDARRDRDTMQRELDRFVEVIEGFVDPIHHGKEEEILFSTLVSEGFPSTHGPLPCMLAEHTRCRAYVAQLRRAAHAPEAWDDLTLGGATTAALQYAELLTGHISKEDHMLYPMAQRFLTPAMREEVDRRAAAFAEGPLQERALGLVALGERLIAEFGL